MRECSPSKTRISKVFEKDWTSIFSTVFGRFGVVKIPRCGRNLQNDQNLWKSKILMDFEDFMKTPSAIMTGIRILIILVLVSTSGDLEIQLKKWKIRFTLFQTPLKRAFSRGNIPAQPRTMSSGRKLDSKLPIAKREKVAPGWIPRFHVADFSELPLRCTWPTRMYWQGG